MDFSLLVILVSLIGLLDRGGLVVGELENWYSASDDILTAINNHLRVEKERLSKLEDLRDTFIDSIGGNDETCDSELNRKDPSRTGKMAHPVYAFVVLNRIVKLIDEIDKLLELDRKFAIKSQIEHLKAGRRLPTRDDLFIGAESFLILQAYYELPTENLVEGKIFADDEELEQHLLAPLYTFNDLKLNAADCFELGSCAYHLKEYLLSIEWFKMALELIARQQNDRDSQALELGEKFINNVANPTVYIGELLEKLASAANETGQEEFAAKLTKFRLDRDERNELAQIDAEFFEEFVGSTMPVLDAEVGEAKQELDHGSSNEVEPAYRNSKLKGDPSVRNLCLNNVPAITNHKCIRKIDFRNYQMGPELKIEILSENPEVVRILDFLTEKEAIQIRRFAVPELQKPMYPTNSGMVTNLRVSKIAWLWGIKNQIVKRLVERISEITGLKTDVMTPLQVINYGLGGHHVAHFDVQTWTSSNDSAVIDRLKLDRRLATFQISLNHVEVGGATVFPNLNLTARPVERSGIFWYNLQRNSLVEETSLHSCCPVLMGTKWNGNIFVQESGSGECGLTQSEMRKSWFSV